MAEKIAEKTVEEKLDELFALVESTEKDGEDNDAIQNLACDLLITGGQCNWTNINRFKQKFPGIRVVALEQDSFGWLIGGIKYQGKTFSYG